jgi:tol-pal system protein YbgF
MSALRDDNRRLTQTVTELRTDRRDQDRRIRDLQHQLDQIRAQQVTTAVDGAMPSLPVVVQGPPEPADTQRVVAVADDGTEIVYEGDAAAGKAATIDDDPPRPRRVVAPPPVATTNDRIEVTHTRPRDAAARTSPTPTRDRDQPTDRSGDAANDYRLAVELVKAGKHDDAVTALRAFIGKYPRHDFADNAQYWLGETFYAQHEYSKALIEFRNVIETYPRGNKVPDALLKVGYCYQALGQSEKARAVLEQVVNLYPKTEPAALAAKRLETP